MRLILHLLFLLITSPAMAQASKTREEWLAEIKPGLVKDMCTNTELPLVKYYGKNTRKCLIEVGALFDQCALKVPPEFLPSEPNTINVIHGGAIVAECVVRNHPLFVDR